MVPLLGFAIAAMTGLTGVGAGSLTVSVLMLLFGYTPATAIGTAVLFTAAIKLVACPIYLRHKQLEARALAALCAGGIPGVILGVASLTFLDSPRYKPAVLLAVGVIISAMAVYTLHSVIRLRAGDIGRERRSWLPWFGLLTGAIVAFSSAGAGAMGSVALLNFTALKPAKVVGTDVWFGLMISAVAAGWHFSNANYDGALLWGLLAGGVPGVIVGARASGRLTPRIGRPAMGILLFALGVQLCWRAFH
jgi:uncharacterized protein